MFKLNTNCFLRRDSQNQGLDRVSRNHLVQPMHKDKCLNNPAEFVSFKTSFFLLKQEKKEGKISLCRIVSHPKETCSCVPTLECPLKTITYINLSLFIFSSPFFHWHNLFLPHTHFQLQNRMSIPHCSKSVSFFSAKTIQYPAAFQTLILLKALAEPSSLAVGLINSPGCWYLSACQFKNPFLSTIDHCRERSALTKKDSGENTRMQRLQMNGSKAATDEDN